MSTLDNGLLREIYDENPYDLWKLKDELLALVPPLDDEYFKDPHNLVVAMLANAENHFDELKEKENLK